MLNFLIYSGSARQGNFTQHVASFVHQVASKKDGITTEVISPDILKLNFNQEGNESDYPELRKKVIAADGFILVTPEYNHSFSGSLKFMLDLNLKEYHHKPAAMVGVSAGPWGGTRAIENLINPLREMGLVATAVDMNVTSVQSEIVDGKFTNQEAWEKRTNRMLDELIWMAEALQTKRNQ